MSNLDGGGVIVTGKEQPVRHGRHHPPHPLRRCPRLVNGDRDGAAADADVGGGKTNVEGGGRPVAAGTAVFPLAVPQHV